MYFSHEVTVYLGSGLFILKLTNPYPLFKNVQQHAFYFHFHLFRLNFHYICTNFTDKKEFKEDYA